MNPDKPRNMLEASVKRAQVNAVEYWKGLSSSGLDLNNPCLSKQQFWRNVMQSTDSPIDLGDTDNQNGFVDLEPLNSEVIKGFADASSYYYKLVNEATSRAYNKGLRVLHMDYCDCSEFFVDSDGKTLPKDYPYPCLCTPAISQVGDIIATSNLILTTSFACAAVNSYENDVKPYLSMGILPPMPIFTSGPLPAPSLSSAPETPPEPQNNA